MIGARGAPTNVPPGRKMMPGCPANDGVTNGGALSPGAISVPAPKPDCDPSDAQGCDPGAMGVDAPDRAAVRSPPGGGGGTLGVLDEGAGDVCGVAALPLDCAPGPAEPPA